MEGKQIIILLKNKSYERKEEMYEIVFFSDNMRWQLLSGKPYRGSMHVQNSQLSTYALRGGAPLGMMDRWPLKIVTIYSILGWDVNKW
jgi:hypothetical protein